MRRTFGADLPLPPRPICFNMYNIVCGGGLTDWPTVVQYSLQLTVHFMYMTPPSPFTTSTHIQVCIHSLKSRRSSTISKDHLTAIVSECNNQHILYRRTQVYKHFIHALTHTHAIQHTYTNKCTNNGWSFVQAHGRCECGSVEFNLVSFY